MNVLRVLALVCCVSLVAHAELPEKSKWSWSVVSGGGSSSRFLWLIEAPAPARKAREWWTVQTGARREDGRMPLTFTVRRGDATRKSEFEVWNENGVALYAEAAAKNSGGELAVTRTSPPRVLSMERVPCESKLLGHFDATCSGLPGGPLHQPELPLVVVVSRDKDHTGETLASLALGLVTAGIIIPGSSDTSVVARMDPPPTPRLEKTLDTWRTGPRTKAALDRLKLADEVDAETLGALLVLSRTPSLDVVVALTARAPELDRWPLLRLARQTVDDDVLLTRAVARLRAADALHAATTTERLELQASALVSVEPALARGVEGLLGGVMPNLEAVAAGNAPLDAASLQSLQTASLAPGEGAALVALMSPAARKKSFATFLERLPDEEGLAVFARVAQAETSDGKVALLKKVPAWVDRLVRNGHGEDVLALLPFDTQRVALLEGVRARAKQEELPALLFTGLRGMSFDAGRLSLLRNWKATTTLTAAQRVEVLDVIRSDPELSAAARELVVDLEPTERRALVFEWLKRCTRDGARLEAVKDFLPTLSRSEARAFLAQTGFDQGKQRALPVLLPRVAENERVDFFVDCVTSMTFDDARLEALSSPDAPKLNAEQKKRVLGSFHFKRDKAEALLK